MSLSDNLRALRKQKGYSQEQLAERLNVSRQAVSKWESDNGYPEMESLIILSDLFECTIDDLLKNDLTQHNPTAKQAYDKHYSLIAKAYTFAVVLQILIENLYNENLANGLFMVFVTIAVGIFVYFGTLKSKYDQVDLKVIKQDKRNKKVSIYCGIIMMIVTAIYLGCSFTTNAWHISWIVYPIGGIICGIVWLLFEAHEED